MKNLLTFTEMESAGLCLGAAPSSNQRENLQSRRPLPRGVSGDRGEGLPQPPLLVPAIGDEVVVEGEQGRVVEDDEVVEARDWLVAPPLIVDAPEILNLGDRARLAPGAAPDRPRLAGRGRLDPDGNGQ